MSYTILAIPTYNEVDNIIPLYKLIRKYNKSLKILFIDDNSNDGTIAKIKLIKKNDSNIILKVRDRKLGIGSAHKFAFKWAIKNKAKCLVTMDADFTHDPKLIKKMLKLKDNFHIIQTNRFLNKKSISSWPIHRVVLTNLRYYLLYILLNISYDSSGAFRCYNFNKFNPNIIFKVKNNGYSFFWESMYLFCSMNFKIKEISSIQKYRNKGTSKLTINEWVFGLAYVLYIFVTKRLFRN